MQARLESDPAHPSIPQTNDAYWLIMIFMMLNFILFYVGFFCIILESSFWVCVILSFI